VGETISVLITIKAYPAISQRYGEVVCVAGIRTDTPTPEWCRLFPVPFRDLPFQQRFKKYQVIRLEAERHGTDTRPESYRPNIDSIEVGESLPPGGTWANRRPYVEPLIVESMCEVLRRQRSDGMSLAVFRPGVVEDFTIEADAADWHPNKLDVIRQPSLLFPTKAGLEKIPYSFRYRYRCDESGCNGHHQSIIDWELAEAFRTWAKYHETERLEMIRDRWLGMMCDPKRDTMFFVGNQHQAPEAFLVLGTFYPEKS
jgi:hypothetical protein